jgi:hypothetical protein
MRRPCVGRWEAWCWTAVRCCAELDVEMGGWRDHGAGWWGGDAGVRVRVRVRVRV